MARHKKERIIRRMPHFGGFKPYGNTIKNQNKIILFLEEFEAIKLCDYDFLNHNEAAEVMQISRPTFTRIYQSARRKIALAFTEGIEISFSGGSFSFENIWKNCSQCGFSYADNSIDICPVCFGKIKSIAVAVTENNFNAEIANQFGMNKWYFIQENNQINGYFYENPIKKNSNSKGTDIISYLVEKKITSVVSRRFGIKMIESIKKADIQLIIIDKPFLLTNFLKLIHYENSYSNKR